MSHPEKSNDGQLLGQFVTSGSEEFFAELVRRHGPMVHAVCLRVLGDYHEAEDVAQAVFVQLARKAPHLRKDPSVAGWLHHVATCLARNTLKSSRSRRLREGKAFEGSHSEASSPPGGASEFRRELDIAIQGLPERYRRPLVLFHLEERSLEETARELGLKPSAASARLVRGREILRKKLSRRGVGISSVVALVAMLSAEGKAALSPGAAVEMAVQAGAWASPGAAALPASLEPLVANCQKLLIVEKCKAAAVFGGMGLSLATAAALSLDFRDPEKYLIVDLSAGPSAQAYPFSYLATEPRGGWTDEHKTDKLVLRKLPEADAGEDVLSPGSRAYAGIFEVTQRQWELVMGDRPGFFKKEPEYATRPVESLRFARLRGVSKGGKSAASDDAVGVSPESFFGRLRSKTGLSGFDLPKEALWEHARGDISETNAGEAIGRHAGRWDRVPPGAGPESGTAPVGSGRPNSRGLFDMSGNVREVCGDLGERRYAGGRVLVRGGSWADSVGTYSGTGPWASEGLKPFTGFRVFLVHRDQ